MDFHLKQWRNQHESEEQHSTKMPKLLPESHQQQQPSASALPLFVPEPNSSKVSTLSDSTLASATMTSTTTNRLFPRMGSYFSLSQWQELELQALIFRYMLAGAAVPPELLQPIKKSLLHSPHYYHPLQHYQPSALLQSGYWGRGAMDPEPGRCRRTDGKKWRCSRDVVAGQKYCERHMHRGRNRSRKPVELPTPTSAINNCGVTGVGSLGPGASSSPICSPPLASASFKSPFDLHLDERSSGTKNEDEDHVGGDGRSGGGGGHMLRHFFDDWPRSLQDSDNVENNAAAGRSLSISMPGASSDVSLKLSTGYGEDSGPGNENVSLEAEQLQLNWAGGWASSNQVASMGGPLAEALRSSTSTSSPTSVLHRHLPRGSETSFIST
ncbi:growth-regulating factor 3-like [Glycine soja]|uniref:Growth-regulating factor n=1 Tax=Glycine soja TaxID=3848 RepID=A0A445LE73_GLYSO|nr:growth-regulating factor 3-like [Glycine soja]XP_028225981.1 growth-regulating factor 3-like [Glycine soja]RZC21463.1 Growth-regulating factor 4 isoform A [Glycine soja]RZC21464.1 Growth-regulating factor 4 isoform B [Glycine soja]